METVMSAVIEEKTPILDEADDGGASIEGEGTSCDDDAQSVASEEWTSSRPNQTISNKSRNVTLKKRKLNEPGLLDPHWFPNKNRASSPAASIRSESSGGNKPATFIFTLCNFLRNNPESQYMRWNDDGTFFVITNKEAIMDNIIVKLFNQKSYASFARQLNIYGWRRLQISPDGKISAAESRITMWQHPDVTRDTPNESLKLVKRNAQDKGRRSSKTSDDVSDVESASKARSAVVNTTAVQALAIRAAAMPLTPQSSSNQVQMASGHKIKLPPRSATNSSSSPSQVPLLTLKSVNADPIANGVDVRDVSNASKAVNRDEAMRSVRLVTPHKSTSKEVETHKHYAHTAIPALSPSGSESSSYGDLDRETSEGETVLSSRVDQPNPLFRTNRLPNRTAASPSNGTQEKTDLLSIYASPLHKQDLSLANSQKSYLTSQSGFKILPSLPSARRQNLPQNPVDVYLACSREDNGSVPMVIARDRLDVPIWVDDLAQSRFVLAGDLMRSWVVWDIFPLQTLVYVASADATRPPRPIGIPQQLRDALNNGDPRLAFSRERVYLETAAEPGSVGQCCLVFRSNGDETLPPATTSDEEAGIKRLNSRRNGSKTELGNTLTSDQQVARRFQAIQEPPLTQDQSIAFPATPRIVALPPVSEERGSARSATCEDSFDDNHVSERFSFNNGSGGLRTPRTADAVSSLAQMQTLAHAQARAKTIEMAPELIDLPPVSLRDRILSPRPQQEEAVRLLMGVKQGKSSGSEKNVSHELQEDEMQCEKKRRDAGQEQVLTQLAGIA